MIDFVGKGGLVLAQEVKLLGEGFGLGLDQFNGSQVVAVITSVVLNRLFEDRAVFIQADEGNARPYDVRLKLARLVDGENDLPQVRHGGIDCPAIGDWFAQWSSGMVALALDVKSSLSHAPLPRFDPQRGLVVPTGPIGRWR